jgi:hypothetical protein
MSSKLGADLKPGYGDGDLHQKQFGDVNVAADILDLSPSYLNKLRMTGSGPPYVKFGAAVRYILPQLLPWALGRARASTSDPGQAL